ncbi:BnaC09g00830D [Brassica napus]|uniref:BnaC09g00660D protein n=1 Tax=Brassica napus TaxID=3708 RepID=A0A078GAE7_BRANA|nr:BnaC09g00660D [Brassica napus]CDY21977.1 BnaC09g00830D [Brassica napus]
MLQPVVRCASARTACSPPRSSSNEAAAEPVSKSTSNEANAATGRLRCQSRSSPGEANDVLPGTEPDCSQRRHKSTPIVAKPTPTWSSDDAATGAFISATYS